MDKINIFLSFLLDIVRGRAIILELTKKDFQVRYLGSYLGILWAFVQPSVMIAIFWFVFEVGFKTMPIGDYPFILWLMTGMIPWFFFSESVASATSSILDNSYLVKKVVFRVSLLPTIKILSALVIHAFFIGVLFCMFFIYGYPPQIYNLQVLYYLFAMIVLILGISWITSSLIVFMKDVGQVVGILLQFAFWLTPIFWSFAVVPVQYQRWLKLNPVYYLVEGYRNSFIYHQWFWEDRAAMLHFWIVAGLLFIGGAMLFHRLRPHFADVL